MSTSRQSAPSFFRQGLLIVLPVAVLAGAGLFSIRQDRAIAQREAVEQAQGFADRIAEFLWTELTDSSRLGQFTDHTFRIDNEGRLFFPPPSPTVPVPQPFDLGVLDEPQRQLWTTVHDDWAELKTHAERRANAISACRDFIDSKPPTNFAAAAQYRFGLLLEENGQSVEAISALNDVVVRYPNALSESGLPLSTLAEWSRIQIPGLTNLTVELENFCSNLVSHPTFLTPHLLNEAQKLQALTPGAKDIVARWKIEWDDREALHSLAAEALAQTKPPMFSNVTSSPVLFTNTPPVPKLFWFHAPDLNRQPQPNVPPGRSILRRASPKYRQTARNIFSGNFPEREMPTNITLEPSPRYVYPPREASRFWLASRHDDSDIDCTIACQVMGGWSDLTSTASIGSPRWLALRDAIPPLPAWFGATVELAGLSLVTVLDLQNFVYRPSGKGGGQTWQKLPPSSLPEILATAHRYEQGTELLKVNLHLVSPEMLFARQRTRSYLFGGLIAASALAAIVGFFSARRAFYRQQQLSEMKSNFVSSVSHELRAPIASVRLLAESLERGKIAEPAKQHEYFRFIVQECRRLSSLIENVLDFARIEQGRKQYEFEPTDLPALIRQTVKLMEPAAAEKQITITTNLDDSPLPAAHSSPNLDAQAIQQALINLLDNALKHSPSGETVTVEMDFRRSERPQSTLLKPCSNADEVPPSPGGEGRGEGGPTTSIHLSVTDHGPGIPPEEHEKIFERFYRRGSELRRETHGVGIGLSIVKHIIEAHGGQVRVESEVSKGSRFVVELPLNPVARKKMSDDQ